MELYDLKADTIRALNALQTEGRYHGYKRAEGKTTALLIRARQLLDKGIKVWVLGVPQLKLRNRYDELFDWPGITPVFLNSQRDIRTIDGYLLIDEPWMLNRNQPIEEFIGPIPSDVLKVEYVGAWYR